VEAVKDIIRDEVNVREIAYIADAGAVVRRSAKANFQRLGPRFGKRMKAVAAAIAAVDSKMLDAALNAERLVLQIDGEETAIPLGDLEIVSEEIGGWSVAQEGLVTVALDTTITPELRRQGHAREIVNRIQQMRKGLDLEMTARVALEIAAPIEMAEAITEQNAYIANEVLATSVALAGAPRGDRVETFAINDQAVTIAITYLPADVKRRPQ
ncbi:MAG: DUF5915 domain-containing protein, partial [Gammaproteobacteria bacterium]